MEVLQAAEAVATPIEVIELIPGLSAHEVDARACRASRRGDVGRRELAFYLVDMQERGLHQVFGFDSAVHYAVRRLEMAKRTAQELIAAGRALLELSAIDQAFFDGRLNWTRARLLTRVAVPETEGAWLDKALKTVSLADFERMVSTGERGRPPRADGLGLPKVRFDVRARVDVVTFETWETAKKARSAECGGEPVTDADLVAYAARLIVGSNAVGAEVAREAKHDSIFCVSLQRCPDCDLTKIRTETGWEPVDPATAARIQCDAATRTLEKGHPNGPTPPAMRAAVLARDGYRCVVCGSREDLDAHHVVWRANGGPTTPSNLATLCGRDHGRVHEGLIVMTGTAPHDLTITDRDGNALHLPAHVKRPAEHVMMMTPTPPRLTPAVPMVTFASIANVVTAVWWKLHQGLFTFVDALGQFRFRAGMPQTPEELAAATGPETLAHRPSRLADVIGQTAIVQRLRDAVSAAAKRGKAVNHALFFGDPGLGKTTLARAVAAEIGAGFRAVNGAIVRDVGTLLRILTSLGERAVLFIDEIHALPRKVAETLYEVLEDGRVTVPVTDGQRSTTVTIELPPVSVIGATTEIGMLPRPLVSRFAKLYLQAYENAEITEILVRATARDGVAVTPEALAAMASVGRGVPREALDVLRQVVAAAVARDVPITADLVRTVLAEAGVDDRGLTPMERHALDVLIEAGEPMGLERWAAAARIPVDTLRDQCEPALVTRKLVRVTPLGRVALVDRARPRAPIVPDNWGLCREPHPAEAYRVAG